MHHSKFFAVVATMATVGNAQSQAPIQHVTTVVVIDMLPAISTSTAWLTSLITVLGCPAWETNCPVRPDATHAVVTATIGATTTICPLTLSQARLSSFSTTAPTATWNYGPLSTTTTTWPTTYSLPSSFPLPSSYDIPASVWASIFPTGAPAFGIGPGGSSISDFSGSLASAATSISPSQSSLMSWFSNLPFNTSVSVHTSITTVGPNTAQSVDVTTGSFAAVLSSNLTSYFTTYDAVTYNFSNTAVPTGGAGGYNITGGGAGAPSGVAGAGATGIGGGSGFNGSYGGGSNGTLSGFPTLTTAINGTVSTGSPIPLQTVNVSTALPLNIFSLLVAIATVALWL